LRADGRARTIAVVEPFVAILGLVVVAAVFGFARGSGAATVRLADWRAAAAACGLENVAAASSLGERRLEGAHAGLGVVLRTYVPRNGAGDGTRIVVSGIAPHLELRAQQGRSGFLGRLVGEGDILIGDDAFDAEFIVWGDPLTALALLDSETRRRAAALLRPRAAESAQDGASLAAGMLAAQCADDPVETRAARPTTLLTEMLGLAERLAVTTPREERIAENARADPLGGVRLRNLTALMRERTDHPATAAAVRTALDDADEQIRLTAALASGAQGVDTLRSIAFDANASDAAGTRAIDALGDALSGADAERILSASVAGGREAMIVASLHVLARHGAGHIESIAALLPSEARRAREAARALGETGSEQAAPALVDALAHRDRDVRIAAATALGRVGSSAGHVVALRQAEASSRHRAFLRAARQAIASIQSRLVGADHGQLALTLPAGELSLPEPDAAGRLSPTRRTKG
jgi:HEAT repeat protein